MLKDWKKEVWGYMNKKDNNYQITIVKRFRDNKRIGTGILISKGMNVIENKTHKIKTVHSM